MELLIRLVLTTPPSTRLAAYVAAAAFIHDRVEEFHVLAHDCSDFAIRPR